MLIGSSNLKNLFFEFPQNMILASLTFIIHLLETERLFRQVYFSLLTNNWNYESITGLA